MRYAIAYRLGIAPWERYGVVAKETIKALLDREEAERGRPLGRALDVGCGRGQYTSELARRGWSAVGIDIVPAAIAAARRLGGGGAEYVVGDATDLGAARLGAFDFFLDVGCFQGLDAVRRRDVARGVTALANPGATVLMLAFQPTRARFLLEGVSQAEVEEAFMGWSLISVEAADTGGLGWPMSTTAPRWYRLRRPAPDTVA